MSIMSDLPYSGRLELARRLHRIFLADSDTPEQEVSDEVLLRFADDLLTADYHDPEHGDRPGDGGPAAAFVTAVVPIELQTIASALLDPLVGPLVTKLLDEHGFQLIIRRKES